MVKKILSLFLILLFLLPVFSCGKGPTTTIGAVLYTYADEGGNLTYIIDHNKTPVILKNLSPAVAEACSKIQTGTWVEIEYTGGVEETYPASLTPSSIIRAHVDYGGMDYGFLQRLTGYGWLNVVNLPSAYSYILMKKPEAFENENVQFLFDGDGKGLTLIYSLERSEKRAIRLPLVRYTLPRADDDGTAQNDLEHGHQWVSTSTSNVCMDFTRYAYYLLTGKTEGIKDAGGNDVELTLQELQMVTDIQEGFVEGLDWDAQRELLKEAEANNDEETKNAVYQNLKYTDQFLKKLREENIWVAGVDHY